MPAPAPAQRDPGPPIITRRSLLGFSAIATVAPFASSEFYDASHAGAGRLGMAAALTFAIAIVLSAVAWIGGNRLAGRSGSMLWLCVVALTPPFGSLAYSIWGPAVQAAAPPGSPPPPGFGPRR